MPIDFNKKIPSVKFHGFSEEKKTINSQTDVVVSKRLIGLVFLSACLIIGLFARFAYIQIYQADNLKVKLDTYASTVYSLDAPRGEITDRNYTKLVSNNNVVCVSYFAPEKVTTKELEYISKFLSEHVAINMEEVTERNKKDYFISAHKDVADSLVTDEEKKKYANDQNGTQKIYSLKLERITMDLIAQYMNDDDIEYYRFLYLMQNCKSGSVILAENITVEEASFIGQNSNLLKGIKVTNDWSRQYLTGSNFTQVLGKVSTKKQGLPSELKQVLLAKDYSNDSRVGTSGIEKTYEDILKGTNTTYSLSYNKEGYPQIVNQVEGESGNNVRLTIDWDLQSFADNAIETELKRMNSSNRFFEQMYFMMMDPNNGEILVMSGKQINKETGEVSDIASGNYVNANKIGSTVKGGTIYTAFKNNIITPNTYFVDEPIYIKGTPSKKSHRTMGNINEIDALAYSSNVYMFRIAMKLGGAEYVPHESLYTDPDAFTTLRNSLGELGLGVKTGMDVDSETLGYRGSSTASGHLLDASIGQYDTYSTAQLMQYTATLANGGKRIKPKLMMDTYISNDDGTITELSQNNTEILDDVSDQSIAFSQIKAGMRACVTRAQGTGNKYWSTKPYVAYVKTGTAEDYTGTGKQDYPNHLQIGYIAADENSEPVMAFAAVCVRQTNASDGGSSSAPVIASSVMDKYVEKYGLQ